MSHQIELARLPRALNERGVTLTYQQAWRAATEGRIPAERIGRQWFVAESDLDQIAQTLSQR